MNRFLKYFLTPIRRGRLVELVGDGQAHQAISVLLRLGYIRCEAGSWACTQAGLRTYIEWLREQPLGVQTVVPDVSTDTAARRTRRMGQS